MFLWLHPWPDKPTRGPWGIIELRAPYCPPFLPSTMQAVEHIQYVGLQLTNIFIIDNLMNIFLDGLELLFGLYVRKQQKMPITASQSTS